MANSGSFNINASGQSTTFNWKLNRQDIVGNYSVIDWWWDANWSSSTWYISTQSALWVNGGEVFRNNYNTSRRLHGGRIAGGQITVYHNSDGTKSFGANGEIAIINYSINGRGNGWWDLPRIPRNATLLTAQDFTDEGNPKITYSNPAGNNLSILRAAILAEDKKTLIVPYREISKTASEYIFHLTESERNAVREYCKNKKSAKINFFIHSSIAGNESWSNLTKIVSIINANPVFSNFTYNDINSNTTTITGNNQILIQGKSTLKVIVSKNNAATAKKQASIRYYTASIGGQTKPFDYLSNSDTSITIGTINTAGSNLLSVVALDSRNNSTTISKQISVVAYKAPVVIASGSRKHNFDKETKIHIEGLISLIQVGGVARNSVNNVQYRYREQGTSSWSGWTNRDFTMGANGTIGTTDFWLNLDNNKAFEFQAKITDRLETSVANFTVGVGIPIMRIGLDGLVYNKEQPLMPSHIGQIIFSTTLNTAEKVQAIYGGEWVSFGAGRAIVGVDTGQSEFNSPEKTGGTKTVTLKNYASENKINWDFVRNYNGELFFNNIEWYEEISNENWRPLNEVL